MLDFRRTAAPLRAARLAALAAALMFICLLAATSAAHASSGEIRAWGTIGPGADQFTYVGPTAVDPSDDNAVYVADLDTGNSIAPRLRKFDAEGNLKATIEPPVGNPDGQAGTILALAVDQDLHRVYVLVGAKGSPDSVNSGNVASMSILAYSTQESGTRLVKPADLSSETLIDFRLPAGGWVDNPTAIAVDPTNNDVAVIGDRDISAADPTGVIQYVHSDGRLGTPVVGLGAGVDPGSAGGDTQPNGMAIDQDGNVYIPVGGGPVSVYRLPKAGGAPQLVATDPAANNPRNLPSINSIGYGEGVPIAVSTDGRTVWLPEGTATVGSGVVRGFDTATGDQVVAYGGGTTSCSIPNRDQQFAVAAGSGDQVFVTSSYFDETPHAEDSIVHVFGPGGTGCPQPQALFTVAGRGDGDVTVTKGQAIQFDASMSQLQGGTVAQVDWDWDGSGAFADHQTGADAQRPKHTFTGVGTFRVGVKIHLQGGIVTDPVFHTVTVVGPKPTAVFTASTRTPGAGGTVTFDATNSLDPGATDQHRLAKYHWDFGDGSAPVDTTTPTTSHAFANGATANVTRTVKLVVTSGDNIDSDAFSQAITVGGTPAARDDNNRTNTNTNTTPTTPVGPPTRVPPVITFPNAAISGASVDPKGTLSFKVVCPSGGNPCTGTITLTTKVTKKVRGKKKVTTVKLGTVTFTVDAGKSKAVKVKLSATGRSLLKKSKRLAASAALKLTVSGQSKTTTKALTLRASSAKKH